MSMILQTWLPFPNYAVCAHVLDDFEIEESIQGGWDVQRVLRGALVGYSRHPTVLMWRDTMEALYLYLDCLVRERVRRGSPNDIPMFLAAHVQDRVVPPRGLRQPRWLGEREYHSSQRGVLRTRNSWYDRWQWAEEPSLVMKWPGAVA